MSRWGQPDGVRLHRVDQEPGLAAGGPRQRPRWVCVRASHRPDPRTVTGGSPRDPVAGCWPVAVARASSPSATMVSSTASAAARGRVAAERAAVVAGPSAVAHRPGRCRPRWAARRRALGRGDRPGDAVLLVREPVAGAAQSALDLVAASAPAASHASWRPSGNRAGAGPHRPRPAGLEEHRRGVVPDGGLQCRRVAEQHQPHRPPGGPNGSRIDALPVIASDMRTGRGRPRRRR